jgi:hypothetical protein
MANETTTTIYSESPGIEANRLALIKSVQDLVKQNLEQGVTPRRLSNSGFFRNAKRGF